MLNGEAMFFEGWPCSLKVGGVENRVDMSLWKLRNRVKRKTNHRGPESIPVGKAKIFPEKTVFPDIV